MRCLNRTGEVWKFFFRDGAIQTFYPISAINLEQENSWQLTLSSRVVKIKHADWIYMQRVMTETPVAKRVTEEPVTTYEQEFLMRPFMWEKGNYTLPDRVFCLVKKWANLGIVEASCELNSPDLIMVVDRQDGKPRMHYFQG